MKKFILYFLFLYSINLVAQDPALGWSFDPTEDVFDEEAWLDLSYLNEDEAGQQGFVGLTPDGNSFVDGAGNPIRFWASGGGGLSSELSDSELDYYAKFLAKRGVNIVRYHAEISPDESSTDFVSPNMQAIDQVWRAVAAFKQEGIYMVISPHWPFHIEDPPAEWGFGPYVGNANPAKPWGALYVSETYQEALRNWVTVLYGRTNPYTGMALKDDPAVAMIQMLNEDGIFFWTINSIADWPEQMAMMQEKFYNFLLTKYVTIDSAYSQWGEDAHMDDDPDGSRMGIENIWAATLPNDSPEFPSDLSKKRLSDQIQFMAELQEAVYASFYEHYRNTIGCQQLINTTNWKTASSRYLYDAERWTNTAADVVAVNRYVSPTHVNLNNPSYAGYRIDPGDHYVGESVLVNPNKLPIGNKQVSGHPFMVTEGGWNLPAKYQAEGPWLISAYSSLNGVDGFFWFNPSHKGYDDNPYFDFWREYEDIGTYPMLRWTSSIPGTTAMYPANAYIYRKDLVKESTPVVVEHRTLQSLWDRELPVIAEENGFDPNRDSYGDQSTPGETEVIPLAFLSGKIEVAYGQEGSTFIDPQVNTLVNLSNKTVESSTGELSWDYEKGLATMSTLQAQGAVGFFSNGVEAIEVALPDVTLTVRNQYAAVSVVALDDTPLSNSSEILVQIGTVYRPTGWVETQDQFETSEGNTQSGFQIINTGRMPWKAANTLMSIEFRNQNIRSAHALTINGEKGNEIMLFPINDGVRMYLPYDAMYIILNNDEANLVAGIGELNDQWTVYPNPANDGFQIKLEKEIRSKVDGLELIDIHGRSYLKKSIRNQGITRIDRAGLRRGIYFLILKQDEKVFGQRKLVVE